MLYAILWYLAISLTGWLALPLVYRLLPALPDRGFSLARSLGLLLWGYIFWLLASLGILHNDLGGLLFALLVLIGLSGWALRGGRLDELGDWLREQRLQVVSTEIVFLAGFAWMAFVRAANPEILGTEKPMELAFINAILHSPEFPPHDPWLSGYAISYYYFGYVMVAMLAKLTGTPGGVAFNLGVTLVFALSAVGAYGMVFNLLAARAKSASRLGIRTLALLGPLLILLVGNLAGFLEVLHARGLFWNPTPSGELSSGFWEWLDLRELSQPPEQPGSWAPTRYLWWWRASRVVQDYDFAGNWKEVIDEFPSFSYLLADLHPHVLGMPFAFLAMALVLNLALGGGGGQVNWLRRHVSARSLAWGAFLLLVAGSSALITGSLRDAPGRVVLGVLALLAGGAALIAVPAPARSGGLRILTDGSLEGINLGFTLQISTPAFALAALGLGGLGFLNTWDFPFYVALFAGVYLAMRLKQERLGAWAAIGELTKMGLALTGAGVVLYLPFYLGFSSQAGGILPSLVYFTRGAHLWIMFAPLLLPLFGYLIYLWRSKPGPWRWQGFALALGLSLFLALISALLAAAITLVPGVRDLFLANLAAPELGALLGESLVRRLGSPGGWITMLVLLGGALSLAIRMVTEQAAQNVGGKEPTADDPDEGSQSPGVVGSPDHSLGPDLYALFLVILGALLVLGPDFFYLRDLFGWRINTIFKFYYQAWLLWGVAAAYASGVLLRSLRGAGKAIFGVLLTALIGMGLTYTVLGIWEKTNGFVPPAGLTLDGTAYLQVQSPDELAAIDWLSAATPGVVAEAVGGSYTGYARIATLSGQPTVLGWDFHETQWRGGGEETGSRKADIQRLYCTRTWEEAEPIIRQYQIRYIFLGNLERSTYTAQDCAGGLNEAKFIRNLPAVFQQGEATIYAVP